MNDISNVIKLSRRFDTIGTVVTKTIFGYYFEHSSTIEMKCMDTQQTITALAALAQESRLAVFRLLVQTGPEGMAASKIGEALGIPASSLSFHLKELTHAGLITARQDGRFVIYSAHFETMNALLAFLTENCCNGATCAVPAYQPCQPTLATL
jgi:ArsR family transcriptional regulator, arsenate/arsenite/antimonite-responsive transcriptional repressor